MTGVLARLRAHTHARPVALSNTTLGILMATINQSIVIIALPDISAGVTSIRSCPRTRVDAAGGAPVRHGIHEAFYFAAGCCVVAAIASLMRGGKYFYAEPAGEDLAPAAVEAEPVRAG